MSQVSKNLLIQFEQQQCKLTELEINLLFEIFGPLPVRNEFSARGGLIGLGKSRTIVANQDQLQSVLYRYIDLLTEVQQLRLKDLIQRWVKIDTKVVKFDNAERVKFRVGAPEEQRVQIKKLIQTYIPIYTLEELHQFENGNSNTINRG